LSAGPRDIRARDNPLLQRIRRLASDPAGYRRHGSLWIEGEHLIGAAYAAGHALRELLIAEGAWDERPAWRRWCDAAERTSRVPDALYRSLSTLESPAWIGALIDTPATAELLPAVPTVVLDRLQDAGNAGSILRSAAAFGVHQVLALTGTVALWSPKVLRAGMGAHFSLRLAERLEVGDLDRLQLPWLATSSHGGLLLGQAPLPRPCAWIFGHEGGGVDPALVARCSTTVRIAQPGGQESLNVAAAAAICLHAQLPQ
jgi:TrmH family RNA methyltransferase